MSRERESRDEEIHTTHTHTSIHPFGGSKREKETEKEKENARVQEMVSISNDEYCNDEYEIYDD